MSMHLYFAWLAGSSF